MTFKLSALPIKDIRHVQVRMLEADFDELEKVCRLRRISKSDFVNQAISYAINNLDPLE